MKLPARFMSKVVVNKTGCWEWQAGRDKDGYGKFWWGHKTGPAHRFAYERVMGVGLWPDVVLDHRCRNRRCVNPRHLEPVSADENYRRGRMSRGKDPYPPVPNEPRPADLIPSHAIPIPGYEGYLAGEDGHIYSVRTERTRRLATFVEKNGGALCLRVIRGPSGHPKDTVRVRKLVALAFLGECPQGSNASL